ncbi:Adenine permease AdeP [bacterium HR15]|nr:Adenine permease AdeP [bacterium HR15]
MGWLDKLFGLRESGTTVRQEVLAGLTTFLTMSYIIFVNPAILSAAGMDKGAVMVATCLCAAAVSILIGLLANYPIAGAPGMGHNAFFAYTVCLMMGYTWQQALAAVFISGVLFILLSAVRFREAIVDAIPESLKHSIAVGIGLLITLIGLEWGGFIQAGLGTLVQIGDLSSPSVLVASVGFIVMAILTVRGVRGAILLGLITSLIVALLVGLTSMEPLRAQSWLPPSVEPTLLKLDLKGLLGHGVELITIVFIFFLTAVFDTVGTLIGVSAQAGLLRDGKLPRAGRALLSDAIATTLGGLLGTSTITAYIESAAGVSAGGRTGLTAIVTGLLMLAGLFLYPLVAVMTAETSVTWTLAPGVEFPFKQYPIIAPALILVGAFMLTGVRHIRWDDLTEALPAFLTIAMMAFTVNITEGIAVGFISYVVLKLVAGRLREIHWMVAIFALVFLVRYMIEAMG